MLLTLPTMHVCEFLYVCIVQKVKLLINGFHFGSENSTNTCFIVSAQEGKCVYNNVCVCVRVCWREADGLKDKKN